MTAIGWQLRLRNFVDSTGGETTFYPFAESGTLSYDATRDVSKTLSGLTLPPSESVKLTDPARMELELTLVRDDVEYLMGYYSFLEDTLQKSVVVDADGNTADLRTVSLGDRQARLLRNDGTAQTLLGGFDPSLEMQILLSDSSLPASVSGSVNIAASPVTWDGTATVLSKVKELAELAGHRPPWMDNQGVIRSVQSNLRYGFPTVLEDLEPVSGSIGVSSTYLSAPNRVVVSDNSFPGYTLMGTWEAPASAPHSFFRLGYYRTEVVEIQGLGSSSHAQVVAQTIGERRMARQLDFQCLPTHLLDGPVVISYDGVEWLLQNWSVDMSPGSFMQVTCEEMTD